MSFRKLQPIGRIKVILDEPHSELPDLMREECLNLLAKLGSFRSAAGLCWLPWGMLVFRNVAWSLFGPGASLCSQFHPDNGLVEVVEIVRVRPKAAMRSK
ncbi:hypothetical protein [Rhizobium sp. L58/93]|uniref:hypothetical protein n=1 Tax=Rhizobium sp. L58/93 TaxID=2820000 RepID=UPI001ADA0B52|nr:hypothetical protein [Rhizobium sp. L58/93]MBO9101720.1 hypothetical protein [Rhizobium sp. L58/93]